MSFLDNLFYHWGVGVATYPKTVVMISLMTSLLLCVGLCLLDFEVRNI